MIKKTVSVFIFLTVSVFYAYAGKPPTLPVSYNGTPLSAAGIAMGGAGVALPGNINGIYFNSASIGYNKSDKVHAEAAFVASRQSSMDENALNLADPLGAGFNSVVIMQEKGAIAWRTLSSYKINAHDGDNWYRRDESIKAVTISAANMTETGGSAGINISYLYGTLAESSITDGKPFAQTSAGNGFSIDIGYMYPVTANMYFGINFENVIGFMWWANYDYDQLPFGIRAGWGYSAGTFSLAVDLSKKFYRFGDYDDTVFCAGFEQYLSRAFCLRIGAQSDSVSDENKIKASYGFGLNISVVSLSVSGESYKADKESISKYYFSLKVVM